MRFAIALISLLPLALAAPGVLDNRQTPCAFPEYKTELVGDGDPHQNYYHVQLSQPLFCNQSHECTVGHERSESVTVGWSGGVSGFDFFSGSFEVQETFTTGDTYECGGQKDEVVCIWYIIAHTAYTVDSWIEYPGCPTGQPENKERAVIKAPNKDNEGGGLSCRIGPEECRVQGDNYWVE
ncbi:hypothetical protein QBC39DRAFT_372271 [Podospora conica]|nr:hypothetical protein QBC39DRAFT_372271 [Schizothecium conicum]